MSDLIPASHLIEASMSKTDLLLLCQWWASPFARRLSRLDEAYPLRFGSGAHKCFDIHLTSRGKKVPNFAAVAKKYNVEEPKLRSYFVRWKEFFQDTYGEIAKKCTVWFVEKKVAYDPFEDMARFLESKDERDYSGRSLNEFPGTCDLVLVPDDGDQFIVFDWKTGQSSYDAKMNGQLASTALSFSRELKRYNAEVHIVRIDDDFIEDYPAQLDLEKLEHHRKRLRAVISAARTRPAMVIGDHCKDMYCPVLETCPAHIGPLAIADDFHDLTPERKANLFARYKAAEKAMEMMGERWKREIEMNGPFQLENGKWAILQDQSGRENLSKKSIIRAMGAIDGMAKIEELDKLGCIEKGEPFKKIGYVKDPSGR